MRRAVFSCLALATAFLVLCPLLLAQDSSEPHVFHYGGFDNQGSVTVGYRFTDIKGYRPKFLELFGLQKGFRLQDFNLFGDAKEGGNSYADSYSLFVSGLGGDPFPTAQFKISKRNVYDFRAAWRQSYYYWNQNDNVVPPIASVAGLSGGLTSNHDWATVRKFGSADLTVHATNNLRLTLELYRTSDDGTVFTTRSPDFFNSPAFWGTYARGNPYYLYAPLRDDTNRIAAGIDYTWRSWSFHYKLGYQIFNERIDIGNVTTPELSINSIAPSPSEPLSFSSSQSRRLTTPISEFSFVGKPAAKLEWRGGYIFYRYKGPASLDQSFGGIAPNSAGPLAPYTVTQSGRAKVTEPDHVISQGFTYQIKKWWDFNADYRYSRFTSESRSTLQSSFSGGPASSGGDFIQWKNGLSDLDLTMPLTLTNNLVIRPGVHLMKADIESLEGGVADPALTRRIKTVRPEISFGYQPSSVFSIRGNFHSSTSGSSYTAISPHTQVGTHLVLRFQPIKKISIEDDVNVVHSKFITTNFKNNIHSNSATLSYALNDRFSLFAGFSYSNFFAAGNIVYARGPAPLNDFLRDQEVNRVWQAGVDAQPLKRFGVRYTLNFDRSTGVGQITGEPPAYGPLTWPLMTGTAYFDFPKAGRLSVDLQRTYYIEQIVTANNFSANLLTIRWTRSF